MMARRDTKMQHGTADKQKANQMLAAALRNPRVEVIPLDGAEEAVLESIPKDIRIPVTASPVKGIEATLDLTERLAGHGFKVAPHLSARLIRDEVHLREILDQLREAGVRDAFVIAGDAEEPAGKFEGAAQLLRAMAATGHHFEEVGISGYPESHPIISDETTIQAMYDKAPYATYIVSQICFDADVISSWARWVKRRGVALPIYVGMPGPVSRQKLMRISARIGLGESARFLKKNRSRMLRMFLPGGYNPDRLIKALKPSLVDPDTNVVGFHMYTFNELRKTEEWRRAALKRIGAA
jgi:methylenetetrahydrofolate reductase (NADH)